MQTSPTTPRTPARYTGFSPEEFDTFRNTIRNSWNNLGALHIGLSFFLGADGSLKLAAKLPRLVRQAVTSEKTDLTGIEKGAAATIRFPALFPTDRTPTVEDMERAIKAIRDHLPALHQEATIQVRHQCALEGIGVTLLDALPLHQD